MKTTRRNFIAKSIQASVITTAGVKYGLSDGVPEIINDRAIGASEPGEPDAFRISIFSKHLQWLDYNEMAKALVEIGFDGVDLTVRPGGHVLPERVMEDLPKAAEAVAREGKRIYMLTTSIDDPDDPLTTNILKTASSLGIKHYRMGWGHYDNTKAVEENISSMKSKLAGLSRLNEKYSISGEYQNHSGSASQGIYFGGAIWDLAMVLKDINSAWIGTQYDIYHATVEGANTWPVGLKLISPFVRSLDIKDFKWIEREGRIRSESVPLGEGMVDFRRFFSLVKEYRLLVPLSVHYEYPLGGAENGASKLTIKREDVISSMKKDLSNLKKYLQEAGII